jgi:hypothetical protein
MEAALLGRRKAVAEFLDRADAREQAGLAAEAVQIRRSLLEQYGPAAASDPELDRLLERARAGGADDRPAPDPTPPSAGPGPETPDLRPRR